MVGRIIGGVVCGALLVMAAPPVSAESKGCEQIVAANEEGGGGVSAEELAKKLHTDIETVRNCLDQAAEKKPAGGGAGDKH